MKKSFYKLGTLAVATALIISGCNKLKDFGSTNDNPAATNAPITSALLTNVETAIGGYACITTPALYCQYYSETQYPDVSCYSANNASPQAPYAGILYDLQNIIINNTDPATMTAAALNGANANQIAIADRKSVV